MNRSHHEGQQGQASTRQATRAAAAITADSEAHAFIKKMLADHPQDEWSAHLVLFLLDEKAWMRDQVLTFLRAEPREADEVRVELQMLRPAVRRLVLQTGFDKVLRETRQARRAL